MRRALLIAGMTGLIVSLGACAGGESAEEGPGAGVETKPAATAPEVETVAPVLATADTGEKLVGDAIRGGQLYDKWWEALGQDAPEKDHPLWSTQSTNTRSGSDTWRCKECHGWDYKGAEGAYATGSHATGFVGVMDAAGKGGAYVLRALRGDTNPDHDFSAVMDEQALTDLAVAIAEETVDYDQFVGPDKMAAGGDLAVGEELFGSECADCHGPEGIGFNFGDLSEVEYVGGLSAGNPWEFLHKLRFGQPGEEDMPSAIDNGWTPEEQLSVLAYAQGLPTSSPMTEGGQLYDNWFFGMGLDEPTEDQPLWATQSTNTRSGADTWRCKECHGWDYKGAEGAYSSGSHSTGFTGVTAAADMSADEIKAWLDGTANPDHKFSALGDDQVAMLTAFFQEGMIDSWEFISADKSVSGDVTNGEDLYGRGCSRCHGDDGTELNFDSEEEPEYIGTVASGNPWEFFHKAAYGHPGELMVAALNLGWTPQEIADVLAYAQTLPTE